MLVTACLQKALGREEAPQMLVAACLRREEGAQMLVRRVMEEESKVLETACLQKAKKDRQHMMMVMMKRTFMILQLPLPLEDLQQMQRHSKTWSGFCKGLAGMTIGATDLASGGN